MEFHDFISEIDFSSPDNDLELHKLTYSQNEMLTFIHENKFSIIYKRRQEGVSTALCAYILWMLIKNPGYKIGMFCDRGEREHFRQLININLDKIELSFKKQDFDSNILRPSYHNVTFTKFPNGSEIFYLPKSPTSGKGRNLDFVYISEVSFRDDFMNLIQALSPCIWTNKDGKFIITTTDLRDLKDDFFMNGDGISEYWCNNLFASRRFVMIEKRKLNRINFKL